MKRIFADWEAVHDKITCLQRNLCDLGLRRVHTEMIKSGGRLLAPEITKITLACKRQASTPLHFYQNRQLELYASKETKRLTLRQLVRKICCSNQSHSQDYWCFPQNQVFFGRSMNEERLLKVCPLVTFKTSTTWNRHTECQLRSHWIAS
jgi:hypothetical protein